MNRSLPIVLLSLLLAVLFSCSESEDRTAEAVYEQDSLPFMHSVGVSTLISDSGVIRYHLVAEEWDIYENTEQPATWKFRKGLFMERYDEDFHIDLYVQADTAYLHQQQTWELRGRVHIRNAQGTRFITEELFWDMNSHEMWNHQYMRIITPDRQLDGYHFRSNESMTRYSVKSSTGDFPAEDMQQNNEPQPDTVATAPAAPGKMDRVINT